MSIDVITQFSFSLLLALVPAGIWGYIFYKKQTGQKSMTFKTFLLGGLFVIPLLLYKYLWQFFPWLNAFEYTQGFKNDLIGFSQLVSVPLSVLLTFLVVGIIEEVTKFWAMKLADQGRILSIDDAIEIAICTALGFAFIENILYFYNIIVLRGVENIFLPFVFRSLFSTFGHIMFSGILGYYYGLAYFAGPVLQDAHFKKRWPVFRTLTKIFNLKKETTFHEEKLFEGILFAVGLHALFNIFLEMNWTFLLVPYLTGGYILLSYLLEKKEDHKVYGHVLQRLE
jgi:RsiW-degrading membrane proteinase PrsW (M82 family)